MTQEEKDLLIEYIDDLAAKCMCLKEKKKDLNIFRILELIVKKVEKL